jgi:hypothetical protein
MGGMSKPKAPKPPKPPAPLAPPPTQAEAPVKKAGDDARRRQLAASGRSILNSSAGLTSEASTAKKTLLGV